MLEYNQSKNELIEIKDELNKTKDKLNKAKHGINKKIYTDEIKRIKKEVKYKNYEVINLENKLSKKNKYIEDLEKMIKREIKKELFSSFASTSALKSVVDKENYPDITFL